MTKVWHRAQRVHARLKSQNRDVFLGLAVLGIMTNYCAVNSCGLFDGLSLQHLWMNELYDRCSDEGRVDAQGLLYHGPPFESHRVRSRGSFGHENARFQLLRRLRRHNLLR